MVERMAHHSLVECLDGVISLVEYLVDDILGVLVAWREEEGAKSRVSVSALNPENAVDTAMVSANCL